MNESVHVCMPTQFMCIFVHPSHASRHDNTSNTRVLWKGKFRLRNLCDLDLLLRVQSIGGGRTPSATHATEGRGGMSVRMSVRGRVRVRAQPQTNGESEIKMTATVTGKVVRVVVAPALHRRVIKESARPTRPLRALLRVCNRAQHHTFLGHHAHTHAPIPRNPYTHTYTHTHSLTHKYPLHPRGTWPLAQANFSSAPENTPILNALVTHNQHKKQAWKKIHIAITIHET